MGFLSQREGNGGSWSAPSNDLYDIYGGRQTGLFGSIEKSPKQVIFPGVTPREETSLQKIQNYIHNESRNIGGPGGTNVPQHLINDIYSMFINDGFKRKETSSGNVIKQKILDRVYNTFTKDITRNSPLFSNIVTKEIALYLQKVYEDEDLPEEEDEDDGGDGQGDPGDGQGQAGQGEGEGDDTQDSDVAAGGRQAGKDGSGSTGTGDLDPNQQAQEKAAEDVLDKHEERLQNAMKKAMDDIKNLEKAIGKDNLADLANKEPDFMENMDNMKEALKKVAFNRESIKTVLTKILNKSENYFSKNFYTKEESIFESEDFDNLFGLEFLNPIFRNAEIMNIGNESRVYTGKIDLYLDCSGSMSDTENFEGQNIRMSDLVKGIAMVLFRMGMIDKLYFFDNDIYEIKNINEYTILAFNEVGGTNFNKVVKQCSTNGRNSVVITDGEDYCQDYIKNVFWCGIGGTTFRNGEGFNAYRKEKQCVTYDSQTGMFVYV